MSETRKTIRDHFLNPENSGVLETPTGRGEGRNDACGDVLQIEVEVVDDVVHRIVFQARACSAVIGAASLITTAVLRKTVEEARAIDVQEWIDAAGGVPPSKKHAGRVVSRALTEALDSTRVD